MAQNYQASPGVHSPVERALMSYRPPSENDTLLPGKEPRRQWNGMRLLSCGTITALVLFAIFSLWMHFIHCPPYPWTMIETRRGWEKEVGDHELLHAQWLKEAQNHSDSERDWKLKEALHEREVAHWLKEEEDRQDAVRRTMEQERRQWNVELEEHEREAARRMEHEQQQWKLELEEHEAEVARRTEHERLQWNLELEEHRKEVAHRTHQEQERQEQVRKEWAEEYERNARELQDLRGRENQQRQVERQRWEREVSQHDRIEEEHRRREEEERQKLNMYWGHVEAHSCITYGTREYTAVLMNLPMNWPHRVEACKVTPLEIHGVNYLPKSCEDKGPGVVIGRWEVDQHEPDCAPFWLWYKDKGCTSPGSGKRRIEHYLENLPKGGDWREFCATTPAHFLGMEFYGAQECFQQDFGTYGHWEIDEANCL